jgi:hypothetical protein
MPDSNDERVDKSFSRAFIKAFHHQKNVNKKAPKGFFLFVHTA